MVSHSSSLQAQNKGCCHYLPLRSSAPCSCRAPALLLPQKPSLLPNPPGRAAVISIRQVGKLRHGTAVTQNRGAGKSREQSWLWQGAVLGAPSSLGSAAVTAWGRGDSGRKIRHGSHHLRPWFHGDDGANPAPITQELSRKEALSQDSRIFLLPKGRKHREDGRTSVLVTLPFLRKETESMGKAKIIQNRFANLRFLQNKLIFFFKKENDARPHPLVPHTRGSAQKGSGNFEDWITEKRQNLEE